MGVEKLLGDIHDARLIAATEELFVPMFRKQIEDRLSVICQKFRAGETNFLPEVAVISFLREALWELENKKNKGLRASHNLKG